MNSIAADLRFALRQLRRSPGFAATAILTLALGIGANTAMFSLLDQALLRSLPVRNPGELVILEGTGTMWEGHSSSTGGDKEAYFSYPMYRDLREGNHVFAGLLATAPAHIELTRNGAAEAGRAELVSGNYFTVLGVRPALGRLLTPADDRQDGANPVAVLSFEQWQSRFGAEPTVVGSTVGINCHPFQVVGVAPPGFRSAVWGENPEVFVPMSMLGEVLPGKDKRLRDHKDKWLNILGRLAPGRSIGAAEAAMNPLWHGLLAEELKALGTRSPRFVDDFLTTSRMRLKPGANGFSYQRDTLRKPLLAVMGMALLVLLIASVNVASLLLVRSAGRVREFTLRYAVGAAASRIAGQLLLESVLLGLAGGLAGMLLAPLATRALLHQLAGDQNDLAFSPSFDPRLLLFNSAVALAVSVVFGLSPLLQLRRADLTLALRQVSATGSGALFSFCRVVVCLQIALSVLLLVAAGLFVRTMQQLRAVDVGFRTTHLVTFGISPKLAGYAPTTIPALQQRVLDRLAALPGVQAVGATDSPELAGSGQGGNVTVAGYNPPPDDDFDVQMARVTPGYLPTLQVPLLAGRLLTEDDDAKHPRVAIVNEAFAQHFCGTVAACVGRQFASGAGSHLKLDSEIVGVVRGVRHVGVREPIKPALYQPLKQAADVDREFVYLRMATDPEQALVLIRRTMQQLDPSLALTDLRTMKTQIDDSLSQERMVTLLAIAFGVLATLLAGVGIYGVLAYSTAQRTREIGIRMALGASRAGVSRLVLSDVLRLVLIGVALGLPVSIGLARVVSSQLFNVSPADPAALSAAVTLIALVATAAAALPARRAASVEPTEALRTE